VQDRRIDHLQENIHCESNGHVASYITWPQKNKVVTSNISEKIVSLTGKLLSNRPVANEATVSVVQVTFSESLIDCEQVQVDSIVQVERHSPVLPRTAISHGY